MSVALSLDATELTSDPFDIFTFIGLLGQGSYGSVHKAIHNASGIPVAIKVIPIANEEAALEESVKEVSLLKRMACPFVVRFYGSYLWDGYLWIIMEYCAAGSLLQVMKAIDAPLPEEQIALVCKSTLHGLDFLHEHGRIHRDIKAGNIILTQTGDIKLADFGVSGSLSGGGKRQTVIGSPYWMAPEIIQEVGYGLLADIWSLGITAIELAQGHPPYHHLHPMQAIFLIPANPPPVLEDASLFSAEFVDFIAQCLTKNARLRPSAKAMLGHPFIQRAQIASPVALNYFIQRSIKCIEDDLKLQSEENQDAENSTSLGQDVLHEDEDDEFEDSDLDLDGIENWLGSEETAATTLVGSEDPAVTKVKRITSISTSLDSPTSSLKKSGLDRWYSPVTAPSPALPQMDLVRAADEDDDVADQGMTKSPASSMPPFSKEPQTQEDLVNLPQKNSISQLGSAGREAPAAETQIQRDRRLVDSDNDEEEESPSSRILTLQDFAFLEAFLRDISISMSEASTVSAEIKEPLSNSDDSQTGIKEVAKDRVDIVNWLMDFVSLLEDQEIGRVSSLYEKLRARLDHRMNQGD